jgi:hypothetical protein
MINKLIVVSALTVLLAGYPLAQEVPPASPAGFTVPTDHEAHQHPLPVRAPLVHESNHQPAPLVPLQHGTLHLGYGMIR